MYGLKRNPLIVALLLSDRRRHPLSSTLSRLQEKLAVLHVPSSIFVDGCGDSSGYEGKRKERNSRVLKKESLFHGISFL